MATQMVASAHTAAAGSRQGGSAAGLFRRFGAWIEENRRYRRTVAELSALTDRELDDIGLSRGDIEHVARGVSVV